MSEVDRVDSVIADLAQSKYAVKKFSPNEATIFLEPDEGGGALAAILQRHGYMVTYPTALDGGEDGGRFTAKLGIEPAEWRESLLENTDE